MLEQSFQKESNEIAIATDDGSYGARGFVTALLERKLEERPIDRVFICGPTPMMKHAVEICKAKSIPCEVSLEERMGCGIGACLVCACKVRLSDDWDYAHVCKDGPVFSGKA